MIDAAVSHTAISAVISGNDADDKPIDTVAASKLLARWGFPYAVASLDRMRCVGGGARFLKHGSRVFYRPSALRAWIDGKTREASSTSELQAARPTRIPSPTTQE